MARNNNKDKDKEKTARTPSSLVNIHASQQQVKSNDAKEETVKMRFRKDMYYNDRNVPYYSAGVIYDVPLSMVDRWLKRGGEIYGSESKLVGASGAKEFMPEPATPENKTETEENSDLE